MQISKFLLLTCSNLKRLEQLSCDYFTFPKRPLLPLLLKESILGVNKENIMLNEIG